MIILPVAGAQRHLREGLLGVARDPAEEVDQYGWATDLPWQIARFRIRAIQRSPSRLGLPL